MVGDMFPSDHDFQVVRIGQDLSGGVGVGGRDGVAVGVELHKAGFTDLGQDDPVGAVRDLGQGFEFFFLQQIGGFSVGGAVNPLISLLTPEVGLTIGFIQVLAGGYLQEVFEVPDRPFDPSLLIGPPGRAGVDRKAIVSGKVQKLGVEGDLWGSLEDDTLEIIIPVAMGYPADFLKGSKVAIQEELQRMAGVEVDKQVSGVS